MSTKKVHYRSFSEIHKPIDENIAHIDRFVYVDAFNVVVPQNYHHATRMATFKKEYQGREFFFYSKNITDKNYSKTTIKLVPGQKFLVKVFRIEDWVKGEKLLTSDDCLVFLRSQKAVLVGPQGASLAYEQNQTVDKWLISLASVNEENSNSEVLFMWKSSSGGCNSFITKHFEYNLLVTRYLLCFCYE